MKNKVLYWGSPPPSPWTKEYAFWLNNNFYHEHGASFGIFPIKNPTLVILIEILEYE